MPYTCRTLNDDGRAQSICTHALLLLFFFSLAFDCLLLYVCLLLIVMCALDMLLIKVTYLLTYLYISEGGLNHRLTHII